MHTSLRAHEADGVDPGHGCTQGDGEQTHVGYSRLEYRTHLYGVLGEALVS